MKGKGQILSQTQLIFFRGYVFQIELVYHRPNPSCPYDGLIQSAACIHGKYNFCLTEDLSFTFY